MNAPPPRHSEPTIIPKIRLLHREIYEVGKKLPKREKLGIHATIEKCCLELLSVTIAAAFENEKGKLSVLKIARVRSQVLANLIRTEYELQILTEKKYLGLSAQLVEIGKMLNGWITHQTQKGSH